MSERPPSDLQCAEVEVGRGGDYPTVQGRVPTPDCEGVQLAELAVVDTANAEEETRLGGNQLLDLLLKLVATSARQMKMAKLEGMIWS